MAEPLQPEGGAKFTAAVFLGGFLTASLIAIMFIVFLGIRIGFETIWQHTGVAFISMKLEIPDELVEELAAMDGVIDNAGNPTHVRKHDTIIVRPDDEFEKVLRPGVSVDGYQVRARDAVNLDPPVVYTRGDAEMSEALRSYLESNTRVKYTYHVDAHGFRRTVPVINSDRRLLLVGDSATFGVGVDDEDTVASGLQRLIGDSVRVVNAGVSGYNGDQAFRVAKKLSGEQKFEALVYIAHNNDFMGEPKLSSIERAQNVIASFESIADRFPQGVVVALFVQLEYAAEDVLMSAGWSREQVESLTLLRAGMERMTRKAGFEFVDLGSILGEIRATEETIFAPWSLYVDHSHLSPRGTRRLARDIFEALSK